MDDLISRQDAIDAMEQSKEQFFDRKVIIGKMQDIVRNLPSAQPEITLESAIDYLHNIGWLQEHDKALSSAQPEQRWIPCSERLPKNHERVLLSVDPTYTGDGWVDIAYMCYGVKTAEYCFENNTKTYAVDEALAWMPLPDAYEEDD